MSLFDEYKELKKQIEEAIYSPQDDEQLIFTNIQELHKEKTELFTKRIIKAEAELKELEEISSQVYFL